MQTVLIVVHLIIVIALVGTILLQRSEGGALGIGGGGGGMMSARGSANFLTRLTAILAIAFFATSLGLTLVARFEDRGSLIDTLESQQTDGAGGSLFDSLQGSSSEPAAGTDASSAASTEAADTTAPEAVEEGTGGDIDSLLQSLDATTPDTPAEPVSGENLLDALNDSLGTDVATPELDAATTEDAAATGSELDEFTQQLEQGVGATTESEPTTPATSSQ